jgi:NAD(P)-dependent dehydrogenase (short-subunit alcohol dehydrogenase family)
MAISETAQRNHEALFPGHTSTLALTDPELIEVFDNFAFDEVLRHGNLDAQTRMMVQLAAMIACQALREYRIMLGGARVNTISPGIIITPLANDELKGPRGPGYRRMLEVSAAGRAGISDEVGTVGALLMGPAGAFITGSDFLMDGGVTAAYWFRDLAPK